MENNVENLAIIYDERFQLHKPPFTHPENPGRLEVFLKLLDSDAFLKNIPIIKPSKATKEDVLSVHTKSHYDYVTSGRTMLDFGDTYVVKDSLEAASLAAGSVIKGVELVIKRKYESLFCAVRPPGHHAEGSRPMGFCLFNNIAIGAESAISKHGLKRIAIIDWDVHHGNGTQEIFYETEKVFYISLHQYPFYPGTGARDETGLGEGEGYTLNFPLPAGTNGEVYGKIFRENIFSALENYRPQLIMISAGFDAHRDDPIGGMKLTEKDFSEMTKILKEYCDRNKLGIVSVLEGGYNPGALGMSIREHLRVLGDKKRTDT